MVQILLENIQFKKYTFYYFDFLDFVAMPQFLTDQYDSLIRMLLEKEYFSSFFVPVSGLSGLGISLNYRSPCTPCVLADFKMCKKLKPLAFSYFLFLLYFYFI